MICISSILNLFNNMNYLTIFGSCIRIKDGMNFINTLINN